MSFEIQGLLYGVVAPAGLAAVLAVAAVLLGKKNPPLGVLLCGLATALGFSAAAVLFPWMPPAWNESPTLVPDETWHWLPHLAILTAVAGGVATIGSLKWWGGWLVRLAAIAPAAWLLIPSGEGWEDFAELRLFTTLQLAAAAIFTWAALEEGGRRGPSRVAPWLLVAAAVAAAIVLLQAGIAKFAQLGGALTAALAALAAVALWRPTGETLRGAAGPLAILLPGLMLTGFYNTYSEIPRAAFTLVMVIPALTIVGHVAFKPASAPWKRNLASAAAVFIVAAAAVGLALSIGVGEEEW